jgi:hypothetical protein
MKPKEWLSFYSAAQEIERIKGVSPGKAQSMLRQACASGEVRSVKEPYVTVHQEAEGQGPPQRIEPSEWREHEIDLMTDMCRRAADGLAMRTSTTLADLFTPQRVANPFSAVRASLR